MQRLRPDAAAQLQRGFGGAFAGFGGKVAVEELASRNWSSVTFSGQRHEFVLRLEGWGASEAADAFLAGYAEREFEMRGHILADIALVWEERADDECLVRIALEALTVEAD